MRRLGHYICLMLPAVLTACGGRDAAASAADESIPAAVAVELPLPAIPDVLTEPDARADFLVSHFWDAMDFADTVRSLDTLYMEQNFSNFISVLPLATDSGRRAGVDRLLSTARSVNIRVYDYVQDIARQYLYAPESPFVDERLYTPFVEYALRVSGGSDPLAAGTLDDIRRNAPGSPAPDFTVTGRDGRPLRLLADNRPVLLMFYEPGCDRCHEAVARLTASANLSAAVAVGDVRVVAVYIGDDREAWQAGLDEIPAAWEAGIDDSGVIDDGELYPVRATPTFYLINPDHTIALKDASLAVLASAVAL